MDRSSEERSRFEKWALEEWHDCEYTNSIDTDYRDADTVKMWSAWQARAALEGRQEAALEGPSWVCPICEVMAIGSRIYCLNCAQSGLYISRLGASLGATPTRDNAHLGDPCQYCNTSHDDVLPGPCKGHIKCAVCGYPEIDKCHDRTTLLAIGLEEKYHKFAPAPEVQGTPAKDCNMKDDPASEATPSKENARPAGKCGKCGAATYWHGDTWYHESGRDVMKCGQVEPQIPPPMITAANPGFPLGYQAFTETESTAPAQTLAETPGFAEWFDRDWRALCGVSSKEIAQISYRAGTTKALHDARIWLFNQQGRAKLPEILAELLKREREAGGGKDS